MSSAIEVATAKPVPGVVLSAGISTSGLRSVTVDTEATSLRMPLHQARALQSALGAICDLAHDAVVPRAQIVDDLPDAVVGGVDADRRADGDGEVDAAGPDADDTSLSVPGGEGHLDASVATRRVTDLRCDSDGDFVGDGVALRPDVNVGHVSPSVGDSGAGTPDVGEPSVGDAAGVGESPSPAPVAPLAAIDEQIARQEEALSHLRFTRALLLNADATYTAQQRVADIGAHLSAESRAALISDISNEALNKSLRGL